ncbi:MAG: hypothetical protein JSV61_16035 [Anaerolineales bacterium]|nr:MAG: hypothetical protein JSV61_16035 [Anaerolineales bacterium]
MLEDFSTRLLNIQEKRKLKARLGRKLVQIQKEFLDESKRLTALESELSKEKADIENFERLSLTAMFYSVLGSREEQLEKERQELLSAQIKYQKAKFLVASLESERDHVTQQLQELQGLEAEYERLLNEKEAYIHTANQKLASELVMIAEQMANLNAETKELEEAIRAGSTVDRGLQKVISALESAHGWGVWDMIGGGLISTAIKHGKVDEARQAVHEVQAQINQFKRELIDVRQSASLEVEITAFESFADYFFDGLIIDWIVQSKISKSLEQAKQTRSKVATTLQQLNDLKEQALKRARSLQDKRLAILENS